MESEPEHTHTDIVQTKEHCARQLLCLTEHRTREEPQYIHIDQNEFSHIRHKTQTEEDVAICECKYDEHDPESACGERCLNVLTSTECTPGYCPCGVFCKNQVDNSTRDSGVSSECVMDYTSEFTTYEIFKTRDSLMQRACEAGKRNGFVIVTIRFDLGVKIMKPRVTLGCERGGRFKKKKTKVNKGAKNRCGTGTKKCGCPFTLKGEKLASGNGWMLKVVCGVHNHASTEYSEGRSYAGRLSEQETSLLVDWSKSLVRPKEILSTLKQRDELNATTIRTIYNARQRQS